MSRDAAAPGYLDLQILEDAVLGEAQQRRWPQRAHDPELVQQAGVEDVGSRSADGQLLAAGALRGPQSPESLASHTHSSGKCCRGTGACALFLDSRMQFNSTVLDSAG